VLEQGRRGVGEVQIADKGKRFAFIGVPVKEAQAFKAGFIQIIKDIRGQVRV
jgi:hypothetical protein